LFRELLECTGDGELRLFKATLASSTAVVCGQKRLRGATDGKKVTPWWNQGVKGAIQVKKVAYQGWL